ncbi:uncharacterized protein LOC134248751 [Saccostrea cucullata]|uniref:uncharacterized protein LOC134248751 n=1 Tax=Saccostrea cuccullata TaxID=36930 RepID=UPI002ED5AA0A
MKKRFDGNKFGLPRIVKAGALLFTGFLAWHYAGLTVYNIASTKGQEKLRKEGVPEDEISRKSGYQRVMHKEGGRVIKLHYRTVLGEKKVKSENPELQE